MTAEPMNLSVAIYLAGVGLFVVLLASLWLRSPEKGEVPFWPALLLAIAWPVAIVAFAAMLILRLSEKEGTP